MYHNAFGEIVEDSGFECEHLPSDDRVGQGETDKKRLERSQASVGRHAEAHRGDTEGSSCPLCDGVRDRLLYIHCTTVSVQTRVKLKKGQVLEQELY